MPELTYLGCGGTGYTRVYDGSIVLLRFFGMILCRVFSLLFFVLFPPRFVLCRTPLNGKFSRVDMIYRHVHVNQVFLKLNFDCSVTECASLKKLSYIFKKEYFKEENNKCPSWSSRLTFLLNGAFKQPREDGAARQAAHAATVDWFHVASDVEGKEVEITMGPARNQSRREMQTVLVTKINTLLFSMASRKMLIMLYDCTRNWKSLLPWMLIPEHKGLLYPRWRSRDATRCLTHSISLP